MKVMRPRNSEAKTRTVKLYADDAEKLFQMAREKGVTIAEAYRQKAETTASGDASR